MSDYQHGCDCISRLDLVSIENLKLESGDEVLIYYYECSFCGAETIERIKL